MLLDLEGSFRGKNRKRESLHDTRQFARHASICQSQCRWPQTWHLRLPFTGFAGWNWLARCIRFRRSMNHAIEIGKGYFFFFRGFVVVAVTHCHQSPEITLIDRNRVVSFRLTTYLIEAIISRRLGGPAFRRNNENSYQTILLFFFNFIIFFYNIVLMFYAQKRRRLD